MPLLRPIVPVPLPVPLRAAGQLLGFAAVALTLGGCPLTQPAPGTVDTTAQAADCVTTYDPTEDYFPDQVEPTYAKGFAVAYHRHYKVVTVHSPWQDADSAFTYVLVQCGTPVPPRFESAQVIEVPVRRVAALSTTYLPHLEALGEVEALVGVDQFATVNTASVRQKIDRGDLQEFSSGGAVNLERLIDAEPDLVMAFATGNAATDSHDRLIQAGVPVAIVAEYLEQSPLGRAEWLKFTALFFNQEARAEQVFGTVAQDYNALVQLTQSLELRPTVFTGFSYEGTWYMPGGQSYAAQLLRDAGATYLWAASDRAGSLPLDFEAVYDRAASADVWVNVSQDWFSQGDAIAADPRYGQFLALQSGRVFNNNARLNPSGGNDYWESGPLNPHWVLADLIKILHPDLLPNHTLIYYQPLTP
ncbi:ABC transporter substrate-binding protein [Nodosilinea sp. PGN35]|uniref:ABC transporter substrate-binding protein n=1 Tax=Nodosilinea sp. PGN35 TaxID=3020489 RepID=UPI0023B23520|nr:ABC transporter substrate-binding protein [Nodosilinea sp. TSF1-S3]MDF0366272.1 ABC transporter substrate-binding protein [Nodosilinea sp. TSF1-S3]